MSSGRGDEEFEVLDIAGGGWVQRTFKDLSKASVAKQLTVGAATGWCSGFLCGRVGKAAAAALGGSLLLMQIAHHQGYITIDTGKLRKDLKKARKNFEQNADRVLPQIGEEVRDFIAENAFLAGGFTAGFLLGLAS